MTIFMLSLLFIVYTWFLYPLLVYILSRLVNCNDEIDESQDFVCSVTVIIAAFNEGSNLATRVKNIYECNYPGNLIEVLIASDGSTDNTKEVVSSLIETYPALRFLDIQPQQGRANAHNIAVHDCTSEVIIFSDADTRFELDTVSILVKPFRDPLSGFVSGELRYANQASTGITKSVGIYWRFERFLRKIENILGLFIFGTGACCAVRRSLYMSIPPTGDVDFTTPLDVVLQGYACIHQSNAVAWDVVPETPKQEFRARVRMTSKNLYGTVSRWGIKGLLIHPVYSWVIFSHKICRWLTPFALIGLLIGSLFILPNILGIVFISGQGVFYSAAMAGKYNSSIRFTGSIYSFCLANVGFFIGVLKALTGRVPGKYIPMNKL